MGADYSYEISYGKLRVPLYRVCARPLSGVTPIPESAFTGRGNVLVGMEVDLEVFGDAFLGSYTEGDNSRVVATDSMKNIILLQSLAYDGATIEGLLAHLGRVFLGAYDDMRSVRLSAREFPFAAVSVPAQDGYAESDRLFSRQYGDHAVATLSMKRAADSVTITDHRVGRVDMELLKVTGSAFTHFVRDTNTTLPERGDRPLFVHMDLYWRYADPADLLDESHARYVPPEQMRDLAQTVFHEFVSESIQHLVHEMGTRILTRYPQLAEIAFEAQNRTPDPAATSDADPKIKVYTAPFPAFGLIRLTMRRNER